MIRTTITFKSDSGASYLYDDVTGSIFPWDPIEESLLKREMGVQLTQTEEAVLEKAPSNELAAKAKFIQHWRVRFQAFARPAKATLPIPTPETIRPYVWANTRQLILIVTEDCNLRCKYCVYASGSYKYHRSPSHRKMSYETAIKAMDWFAENVTEHVARDPKKKYGLTFYGGEPLLQIKLIADVLDYAERKYPGLFFTVITTNGTQLTPKNVELLKSHTAHLAISIDGPKEEHDRLRVYADGQGTFEQIWNNLSCIKEQHEEYWRDRLMSMSVFDPKSDVEAIAKFFDENTEIIPRSAFANMVASGDSNYYQRFTTADFTLLQKRMAALRQTFKRSMINGELPGSYTTALAGTPILLYHIRSRAFDSRFAFIPYTGCCIPGMRMAVSVDGTINMCERVNGTFPIGHMGNGGLDYVRIAQLIREYQEKVLHKCHECPIARLCHNCFLLTQGNGGVECHHGHCADLLKNVIKNMADYVSILEANPAADSQFWMTCSELYKDRMLVEL